jgi:BirA family biotin operon repressor/biotin-[acetyl-CoA-carboxylase] ligase
MDISIPHPLDATVLQRLLTTKALGRTLHILSQTPSTNDEVKTLATHGALEGTVVLAEQQTKGRGRQGRSFASPAGVGIYLSLLLRPPFEPSRLPQLTLLVAVATAETLSEISALNVGLKWPNDVEIHGKKVAGILTETLIRAGEPPAVIVGIGINVNTKLEQLPSVLHQHATSLALAAGHTFSRHQLIATLLAHLERLYHAFQHTGLASIRERWLHYGRIVGRRVRFSHVSTDKEGTVIGLDEDGALLVQAGNNTPQRLLSGNVTFI